MDLPRSGWYPDPYGAPDLLRWWDGSTWTHHTHAGVGTADTTGGGLATSGAQRTSVQSTTVQPASVQPTTVQPVSGQPTGGGWATRERVIGDWATGDQLAATQPPKGPRTEPQPALPATSVQSAVQPTAYQPSVQPTAYQPSVQPTRYQPSVQPTVYQPVAGGADGGGTQVLFLGGDAWQVPGAPGAPGAPSAPGGPAAPNRYGYQQAQRRRRTWLMSGLVAGTAVAVAVIAVIATNLARSPGGTTADQAAITPPASLASPTPSAAAPSPTPTPTPSVSAPATTPTAVLSDGQSGLSYSQLAAPWQPSCPSDLNSAFSWTAGESASAGQVNGGQSTWYGEACSGPLPAQYNYSGAGDLDNTATNVAQTLENAYYNPLTHTSQPVLSEPISVSGHPGWEIEYQINYTDPTQGATWTTEEAAVVVADTGTGNTPVVFFTSIPANLGESNVGSLVTSLQLTVVPNANSGSPGADSGGSPPANAGGNP